MVVLSQIRAVLIEDWQTLLWKKKKEKKSSNALRKQRSKTKFGNGAISCRASFMVSLE